MYKTTHVLKPSSEIEVKGIYINFLITVMEIWNKSIYKQTCWFCEVLICLYKGNNSDVFFKNILKVLTTSYSSYTETLQLQ